MNKDHFLSIFLVLLILKLANVINWSWWLITLPLWFPFICLVAIFCVALVVGLFIGVAAFIKDYWKDGR